MDEGFMLENAVAEKLYQEYAAPMPIIDYHCHLSPQEIYENKTYRNITEVWLYGDHYKWRAMRAFGIDERFITGDGSDEEKFHAFARTLPAAIGNPLYHWSHLELRRYFGIDAVLNEQTAASIWEQANAKLNGPAFGVRELITKSGVQVICTTDDPADSLEYHLKLKEDASFATKVLPSFRPDKALELNHPGFPAWLAQLGEACGKGIVSYGLLLDALESRVAFFHQAGCRVSDHALSEVPFAPATAEEAAEIFSRAAAGSRVSREDEQRYKTHLLLFLGKLYKAHGWAMQYHINAARNNNTVMFKQLGPDTGYDTMNDSLLAGPLGGLLDALEQQDALSKTILYSLNPRDNHVLGTLIGAFQGEGIPGKIQLGSGWWFNDTKEGMIRQLKALAELGLLGKFVGMLTDSRSFLSYTRHEYFRRILCNLIGTWVENGEYPEDYGQLGALVQDISYNNAKAYFGF
ncbi:glucuronate isomerase [Paenibacillus sp. NFR01]|uniref:glucuronate isomerase n=1 Tax=Paenibacillus sp. NFR01 TaxID=1566279 RepID=UPI000B82AFD2|nr:glucuronate isomerase [Paenibacillus sp. NFR01]